VAADFLFISLRGKLDMHGVHGRRWFVCVGCEDRKMAAHLMKGSDATLIRYGGKPLVKKARRRKLAGEAGARDTVGEDDQWRRTPSFGKRTRSLGKASGGRSLFFRCDL
jgi:hypothetical protein